MPSNGYFVALELEILKKKHDEVFQNKPIKQSQLSFLEKIAQNRSSMRKNGNRLTWGVLIEHEINNQIIFNNILYACCHHNFCEVV